MHESHPAPVSSVRLPASAPAAAMPAAEAIEVGRPDRQTLRYRIDWTQGVGRDHWGNSMAGRVKARHLVATTL